MSIGERTRPVVENISEATAACLFTMVQGNLLALTLSHWWIATQTGVAAGLVASAAIFLSRVERPWLISTMLGVATAAVDFVVHPGQFGPFLMEAVVTGFGAGALSLLVHRLVTMLRRRRT